VRQPILRQRKNLKLVNVLLLSPFFFPEAISTGKYNTCLAEALVSAGHGVSVISSHPVYPDWRPEISFASLPGMKIQRGGEWIRYPASGVLRRALLELWYAGYALSRYTRLTDKPDIVISVFPPSLFFLLLNLWMPRSALRVGIAHDLQGVYAARTGGLLYRTLNFAIHLVEKKCFNACDKMIFLSSSMAGRAIAEYQLDATRCSVHYPFVTLTDEIQNSGPRLDALSPDAFNVVYSGALGVKQNPYGLFAFMNKISGTQENVQCHIFSAGPVFDQLRAAKQNDDGCKVHLHPLVPTHQLAELYTRSDVQIIPQALNTSEGSLPSKLPNLLAAGVPVFVICEPGGELGELIESADAGVVAHTWDSDELAGQFKMYKEKLIAESKAARRQRLQAFVNRRFNIKTLVGDVLSVASKKEKQK